MKTRQIILLLITAVLLVGCFKDVSHKTTYVLKPLLEIESGATATILPESKAFAFDADTVLWTVNSYADALEGIISHRDNAGEKMSTPLATSEPYTEEGEGWLQMSVNKSRVMILAVDTKNKIYGYTQQIIPENLPKLYVSVVFKPWKDGVKYKDGGWNFVNEFWEEPEKIVCTIKPFIEEKAGDELKLPTNIKAYAFDADTTLWHLASYADASAGKITLKEDPKQTRTNPVEAFEDSENKGAYNMEVKKSSKLMVVVVDRTNQIYTYSQRNVDIEGDAITFLDAVFRPWKTDYIYVEYVDEKIDWRFVNEKNAPEEPDPEPESKR